MTRAIVAIALMMSAAVACAQYSWPPGQQGPPNVQSLGVPVPDFTNALVFVDANGRRVGRAAALGNLASQYVFIKFSASDSLIALPIGYPRDSVGRSFIFQDASGLWYRQQNCIGQTIGVSQKAWASHPTRSVVSLDVV